MYLGREPGIRMTSAFDKMKERSNRLDSFRRIQDIVYALQKHRAPRHIFQALTNYGSLALAEKISGCRRGQYCSSVYCTACRNRAAISMNDRALRHCRKRFGEDDEKATYYLRYVTVCNELTNFDIDEVKNATARARKSLYALKRRYPQIWIHGTFEYEVISLDMLTGHKKKTLTELATKSDDNQVLVHFHALMDIKEYDVTEIRHWFGKRWVGFKRCEIKKTFRDQNIADKCWGTSKYPFKNQARLNPTYGSYDMEDAQFITIGSLAKLVKIYDEIGNKGYSSLLIGIGK